MWQEDLESADSVYVEIPDFGETPESGLLNLRFRDGSDCGFLFDWHLLYMLLFCLVSMNEYSIKIALMNFHAGIMNRFRKTNDNS